MGNAPAHALTVPLYTPYGRDATIAAALLREAGATAAVCGDFASFEAAIGDDACFAVVTEEALRHVDLAGISARMARQPAWSDLPFIVLTHSGGGPEQNPGAARLSAAFGNATFLERPFHPSTFVSVARAALKARGRQFEARARIEALDEGERRLSIALLAGRLGSWELDLERGVLTASATCKAVFGRAAEDEFTYADLLAGIHPGDRDRTQAAVRESAATGADYAIEYRTLWPDGSVHWAEIRARVVTGRSGGRRMVGVSSDITARKKAEDDLRRLNETLEERVAARTAELLRAHETVLAEVEQRKRTEEQLRQAQKMEAVGQLTGGLAHDFNNLLAGIIGSLELLQIRVAQGRTAELERYVASAQEAASRAAALTHRLLAFSRRQTLEARPTDVNALVMGMQDLINRTVGPAIAVTSSGADDLWPTLVDPNQLENALLNLCINARDAMPGGGALTIATENRLLGAEAAAGLDLEAGPYVALHVSDTGTGMEPEVIARAFDPFFTTKPLGQGTGLGLSMIYGFVRQSGGQVRIRSETGRGATMTLYLPRHTGPLEGPAAEGGAGDPLRPAEGETVLVVDDEATIRLLIVEVLEDLGYAALQAGDGAAGLKLLRSGRRIDLLVTDVGLPGGMNGRQLADAARTLRPELRILFITGYAESAAIGDRHLEEGMQVLTKPFTMRDLASRLEALLRRP